MPLLRFRRRSPPPHSGLAANARQIAEEKTTVRAQMRRLRKAIAHAQRREAARALVRQFHRHRPLLRARHVALYLAMGSELDTTPLIRRLLQRGVAVYAPRIRRNHQMQFIRLRHPTQARQPKHPRGMRQPAPGQVRRISGVDVLLLPLLALDAQGQRLGQGGGYYDRALSRCRLRPLTVGLSYAVQVRCRLASEPWDQPLQRALVV